MTYFYISALLSVLIKESKDRFYFNTLHTHKTPNKQNTTENPPQTPKPQNKKTTHNSLNNQPTKAPDKGVES